MSQRGWGGGGAPRSCDQVAAAQEVLHRVPCGSVDSLLQAVAIFYSLLKGCWTGPFVLAACWFNGYLADQDARSVLTRRFSAASKC